MTCSVMQRQIKMQVYHRRYSTCSAAWSSLSLPLPPFPTTAVAPWDHPSDAKQLLPSEFRNSHRQLGAASGQGSTPSAVTDGTDTAPFHCSPRATGCHQAAKVPVHQHRCTGLYFQRKSPHLSGFNLRSFPPVLSPTLLRSCWVADLPSSFSGLPPIPAYFISFPSYITKVSRGTLTSLPRRNTVIQLVHVVWHQTPETKKET